jgi:hypothetical protein
MKGINMQRKLWLANIALMMEAARTSETLVNFYQTTRRYNPEDSHLRKLNSSRIFGEKSPGKLPLRRQRRLEENIKMDLRDRL